MSTAREILKEAELFETVARQTLERTFNFDKAKIDTFITNFNTILSGHIVDLINKNKEQYDTSGNGTMHKEKFETI